MSFRKETQSLFIAFHFKLTKAELEKLCELKVKCIGLEILRELCENSLRTLRLNNQRFA